MKTIDSMNLLKNHLIFIYSWLFVFIIVLGLLLAPDSAFAQQGCCSWHGGIAYCDSSVGTYVCNDGTYSPSCGCYRAPPPPPPPPAMTASFSYKPNDYEQTYNVKMTWNHVENTGFSLALHAVPGGDPGPLIDTTNDYFTFYRVTPGTHYVDMKVGINGTWVYIGNWKIDVPSWVAPTPTNIDTPTPMPTLDIDIYTNNKSFISLFFERLFSLFKSKNTITPAPTPTPTATPTPPYTCNCAKTCTQISTCKEAYYQLNDCGCSVRDGDHDGIPCENLCGRF